MTYKFISDKHHGWLRVKKQELINLGIANEISCYSYQYGTYAWLEEDCDVPLFLDAKKNICEHVEFDRHFSDPCPIRNLDRYKYNAQAEHLKCEKEREQ